MGVSTVRVALVIARRSERARFDRPFTCSSDGGHGRSVTEVTEHVRQESATASLH